MKLRNRYQLSVLLTLIPSASFADTTYEKCAVAAESQGVKVEARECVSNVLADEPELKEEYLSLETEGDFDAASEELKSAVAQCPWG